MRRLVQHALAAAGVSLLTATVVVGGLTTGTSASSTTDVAAPVLATSAPTPAGASSVTRAAVTDEVQQRVSRSSQRTRLSTGASAAVRGRGLTTQGNAIAREEAALELKKAATEKKAAEANKKAAAAKKKAAEAAKKAAAEKKKAAEAKRKAAAQREREAAAKRRAERDRADAAAEAKEKRAGYDSDTTSPKTIARQMMQSKYGWGSQQFSCYNKIIMRESAWKVDADNPTSSAYGIPQALPGSKMASAGSDWRTNPATQIEWGLGYVKSRYGTPCSAWGFKSSHGWY